MINKNNISKGTMFGNLTVEKRIDDHKWMCRCVCGSEIQVSAKVISKKSVNSCGCLDLERLEGKQYGRLMVVSLSEIRAGVWSFGSHKFQWNCVCACDKKVVVAGSALMSGKVTDCGCVKELKIQKSMSERMRKTALLEEHREKRALEIKEGNRQKQERARQDYERRLNESKERRRLRGERIIEKEKAAILRKSKDQSEAALTRLITSYRGGAKNRNLVFDIPRDTFKIVVSQDCHYCGEPPRERFFKGAPTGLKANGIDRINSKADYIEGNILPACTTCNMMKRDIEYNEFLIKVGKISSRLKVPIFSADNQSMMWA